MADKTVNHMTENKYNEAKKDDKNLIVISISIFFLIIALWLLTLYTLSGKTETARGTFGDMFGGVNALFSGLAFGGIIITILLQRKELALQREELKDTREELKRSADAQDAQNTVLLSQQYQTTFFSLLNAHTTLIEGLNFHNKIGIQGLSNFYNELFHDTSNYNERIKKRHFESAKFTNNNPFYTLQNYSHAFHSFFGDLITLIKVVDEKLPETLYYDILFNYLTVYEKFIVGLYCDCIEDEYSSFIINHQYDFLKYYKAQKSKYKLEPSNYFPNIVIQRKSINTVYINETLAPDNFFEFNIWIEFDFYSRALTVEKVNIHLYDYDSDNNVKTLFQKTIDGSAPPAIGNWQDNYEVDLTRFVSEEIIKSQNGYYYVDFNFHFKYQLQKYTVLYRSNFNLLTNPPIVKDRNEGRMLTFLHGE
ncbi:hypothetical protein CNR22_20395 [Sphingobacteriaceae bacterium]|nr:hypothetical protein CNR22_20395 [Sphingobacteriaceae bacterium]